MAQYLVLQLVKQLLGGVIDLSDESVLTREPERQHRLVSQVSVAPTIKFNSERR